MGLDEMLSVPRDQAGGAYFQKGDSGRIGEFGIARQVEGKHEKTKQQTL